jgi:hypothetical protein
MTTNTDQQLLEPVIKALDRVSQETKQMVFEMARSMSEQEIIQSFNQQSLVLFNLMTTISKRIGKEREVGAAGYKLLFDKAIKINAKLPIDKYTLIILEYAPEIYAEDENCFLKMSIPDTNVTIGNAYGLIRSKMFQTLWKELGQEDRKKLRECFILLTTYAHVYFYKSLLKKGTQNVKI